MGKPKTDRPTGGQKTSAAQIRKRVWELAKRLANGGMLNEEESAFFMRHDNRNVLSEARSVMKWRTVPVEGVPNYTEEMMEKAHAVALEKAMIPNIEYIDVDRDVMVKLGEKWERYFRFALVWLKYNYRDATDDLILLSHRFNEYALAYEAELQKLVPPEAGTRAHEDAMGRDLAPSCGSLVAQHFNVLCRKELLKGTCFEEAEYFPGTSDILKALSLNQLMLAASCADSDPKQMLDLLSDAMAAQFMYIQGTMKVEAYLEMKETRDTLHELQSQKKKQVDSGAAARKKLIEDCEKETIRLYDEGIKKGEWKIDDSENKEKRLKQHIEAASAELTPIIVAFSKSKKNGLNLVSNTNKPKQWIKKHKESENKNSI